MQLHIDLDEMDLKRQVEANEAAECTKSMNNKLFEEQAAYQRLQNVQEDLKCRLTGVTADKDALFGDLMRSQERNAEVCGPSRLPVNAIIR